jgi:capsular polysaccharide biosynthesis protein
MVAAGVFSFMMPEIHEISMSIEPGVIEIREKGGPVYLDSPANIKAKLETGSYNSRILKRLNIDPKKTQLRFKVTNPKNTNIVTISSECEQDKIATGTKVLEQLVGELSYDYDKIIQAKKEDIEKQIETKRNEITKIETQRKDMDKQILLKLSDIQGNKNQIKLQEAILKNIRERITELIEEVKQIKNNTEGLIQQKNRALEDRSSGDDISLLLYFTTIQQNVACFNQLNNQLNNLRSKEDKIGTEIEKFKKDISDINTGIERLKIQKTEGLQAKVGDINTEIERLKIQKSYIENIKLISEPEASIFPVKPKKKLNVALAGVVSFMLAVFIAFFVEYIQKSKEEGLIKKHGKKEKGI